MKEAVQWKKRRGVGTLAKKVKINVNVKRIFLVLVAVLLVREVFMHTGVGRTIDGERKRIMVFAVEKLEEIFSFSADVSKVNIPKIERPEVPHIDIVPVEKVDVSGINIPKIKKPKIPKVDVSKIKKPRVPKVNIPRVNIPKTR